MGSIQSERTPNPNSLKFSCAEGQFCDDVVAMTSENEADRHPLGTPLFAVEGVDDVFVTPGFVTVSKTDSVDWPDVKPEVETILSEFLEEHSSD